MNNKAPLVSVIMATFNDKPDYLDKAINSILNQSYNHFELIIVDDSTNENTKSVIDSYGSDPRIKIVRDKEKIGFVRALNRALDMAKGDYIARMDGDDIAVVDRLEKQVRYLETNSDTDILGGQIDIIDSEGVITGRRVYPLKGIKLLAFFTVRSPLAHPTVVFRRSIVDNGHRYNEELPKAEDIDFWLRLYNAGYTLKNLPDTLLNYRVDSDFVEKRVKNHDQENYVIKVRRENFSRNHIVFSVISYVMTYIRKLVPDRIKINEYKKENGDK